MLHITAHPRSLMQPPVPLFTPEPNQSLPYTDAELLEHFLPNATARDTGLSGYKDGIAKFQAHVRAHCGPADRSFSLSENEYKLLRAYTICGYLINRGLNTTPADPWCVAFRDRVNGIIDRFPDCVTKQHPTLYRGAEPYDPDLRTLEVGKQFTHKHFTSTSLDMRIAQQFAAKNSGQPTHHYIFVLSNAEQGAPVHFFSALSEQEILLKADTRFVVTDVVWKHLSDMPTASNQTDNDGMIAFVHIRPAK